MFHIYICTQTSVWVYLILDIKASFEPGTLVPVVHQPGQPARRQPATVSFFTNRMIILLHTIIKRLAFFGVYLRFAWALDFDIYQFNTLIYRVFFGIVIKCQNFIVSLVLGP